MNDEPDAPKRGGIFGLMLAHVVCCGGILLVASGALTLSGIGAWLSGGGLAWLAAVAAAVAVVFWARRRLVNGGGEDIDAREPPRRGHRSPTIARTSDGFE